MGIRHISTL